jgi:chorismate-pyruvate lyase
MLNQYLTPGVLSAQALAEHPALSLFQKILLASDGTVTELLSLYAGQPIRARKLSQNLVQGPCMAHLHCLPDARVLHRKIMLCSEPGGDHLFAESAFVFDQFSSTIQHGLLHTEQPIGLLWRQERLEMYRDIVLRQIEHCPETAAVFGLPTNTLMLSRTYTLFHADQQLGVITERFPSNYFR